MIRFENRFDEYAYRVATRELDPSVDTLIEGQWVTIKNGKIVISDGTQKSFMVTTSRRPGRDNISMSNKATYLHGNYEVTTDQFDTTAVYGDMTPLKVNEDGILTVWNADEDSVHQIEAYAVQPPVDGFIRIIV